MKVLKFGGTSVGSPEIIQKVLGIIVRAKEATTPLPVVVSAFSGITDNLIKLGNEALANQNYEGQFTLLKQRHLESAVSLIKGSRAEAVKTHIEEIFEEFGLALKGVSLTKELSGKVLDFIMSFGERLSAFIIAEALQDRGEFAEFLNAGSLVKTDNNFGNAKVDFGKTYNNIRNYFQGKNNIQLITGFVGETAEGETTTLGRGGSDYTASIFGAALGAEIIEIWTDVSGVMTVDPRKMLEALPILQMTYEEAMEMSYFGAKVIYPPTMQPAMEANIPIRIKNTFEQDEAGTLISREASQSEFAARGISSISNVSLIKVEGSGMIGVAGVAMRLFSVLAREKINVILISQASSEHSICFSILPQYAERAKAVIDQEFGQEIQAGLMKAADIETDLTILALVGEKMRAKSGVAGNFFNTLGKNDINVSAIAQGSSELNISAVIKQKDEPRALASVHQAFFSRVKSLHIFLVGTGLVGSTLLDQLREQSPILKNNRHIEPKVLAIADINKMIFDMHGISLGGWRGTLEGGESANLAEFIRRIKELNLPNSVFVDCTASGELADLYEDILNSRISIVTPNKKANSGKLFYYKKLQELTRSKEVKFLYETNVGAGLPVISTLGDLLASGDQILKIEAVLSGTLSYIFNNFSGEKKFSEIVREAKTRGFTEPDPRDDLRCLDFARKLLILGREIGLNLELEDISVQSLTNEACEKATSIDEFFDQLRTVDAGLDKKREEASRRGKVLRYIGVIENGAARAQLQAIPSEHPFYSLSGSDNIIMFKTARYNERPLVVRGPGAGAEVTAGGVFADILRCA